MATCYRKPKNKSRTFKKSYWVMRKNLFGLFDKVMRFRRAGDWMDPEGTLAHRIAAHFGGDFIELA